MTIFGQYQQPNNKKSRIYLSSGVFVFVFAMLAVVQVKFQNRPIILLERFIDGGGWFEITVIASYAAIVMYFMQSKQNVPKWRKLTWTVFSVVFFMQIIIGLLGVDKFLMTGKLHLPIPVMILSGPMYRGQLSVMTILFLSTIVLTGPAWCSQLCYFGAFDNLAAKGKPVRNGLRYKTAIKSTLLIVIIAVTLILRWLNVAMLTATLVAVCFGVVGIAIMLIFSKKEGKMIHCVLYCPIGSIVSIVKYVNPFRLAISQSCNQCMKCTISCKYDALQATDIKNKRPGYTCTLCGDCLATCHDDAIHYKFLKLMPEHARNLYLFLTVSLHAIFLALGRI